VCIANDREGKGEGKPRSRRDRTGGNLLERLSPPTLKRGGERRDQTKSPFNIFEKGDRSRPIESFWGVTSHSTDRQKGN